MTANIEVEQIVLGTLLIDPANSYAATLLSVDDFTDAHRIIFEAIAMAVAEGRAPHPPTLGPSLKSLDIGPMDGSQYLGRLMTVAAPHGQLLDYIRSLKEFTGRRVMTQLAMDMANVAGSVEKPLADFVAYAISQLDGVSSSLRSQKRTMQQIGDMAVAVLENLKSGKKPESISTGLRDLDRIVGGWHRGELAIIAGRTSMGKSAFALSTMRLAGLRGANSLFFSMEMQSEAVSMRTLSDAVFNRQTPIPYNRMDERRVSVHEISRLESVGEDLLNLPLHVDTARGLSVAEIGVRSRRKQDELERQGKRLDLIVIDHLGKIKASDRYRGNKVHEVGEKTNDLANMAVELDAGVIALTQLNRNVEGREDKRPGNADMRDSGNIEEDADMVAFLYRPAYYLERTKNDDPEKEMQRINMLEIKRNVLEVIVSKNRRGPICTQDFFIDVANNVVRDRV
jgi:replicative DNA helicase